MIYCAFHVIVLYPLKESRISIKQTKCQNNCFIEQINVQIISSFVPNCSPCPSDQPHISNIHGFTMKIVDARAISV